MGQELFVRGKKGKRSVELTRAGKLFHPYAEQVIETLNTAKSELNQNSNERLMTIGSSVALTHPFIYEKINLLNDIHNKNIDLLIMDHTLIAKSLIDGVLDLAFVTEPIIHKQLESHLVHREKIGVVVSNKHPLARKKRLDKTKDLEKEYLIFYKPLSRVSMDLFNVKCKKRVLTNQIELVNDLIHNHNGVSFLPSNAFHEDLKNGGLVYIPIHDELLNNEIHYYLVSRKNEIFYEDIFLRESNLPLLI